MSIQQDRDFLRRESSEPVELVEDRKVEDDGILRHDVPNGEPTKNLSEIENADVGYPRELFSLAQSHLFALIVG